MKNLTTETARLNPGQNYAGHGSALIQASHADDLGGSSRYVFTPPAPRLRHPPGRIIPLNKAMRDWLALPKKALRPAVPPPVITPPEPPVPPMVIDDLDLI